MPKVLKLGITNTNNKEIDRSWIPRRCFCEILIAFFTFAIKTNSIAIEYE